MRHIEKHLAACTSSMEHLLLLRYAIDLTLLWQTQSRGNNGGM